MTRRYLTPLTVLVVALAALGGSIAWTASRDGYQRFGMMRFGPGMMGYAAGGSGEPVRDLPGAKRQAQRFADRLDLRVGEVMRFDNHYYAELTDAEGRGATEVLIDPASGTVMVEPGPAMMWNTRYSMMGGSMMMGGIRTGRDSTAFGSAMMGVDGMMGSPTSPAGRTRRNPTGEITAAEARTVANQWLRSVDPGLTASAPEPFPGYFTIHALRAGRVEGMLSVHATTGAVWYHSWHGRFIEMSE